MGAATSAIAPTTHAALHHQAMIVLRFTRPKRRRLPTTEVAQALQ
jgi:hypothetical protein